MAEILYIKIDWNFEKCADIRAKIAKIEVLIDSLFITAAATVANGDIAEYWLETGQTKQKVTYNSPDQVMASLKKFEAMKQYYMNKLQSNRVVLRDEKNFRRKW